MGPFVNQNWVANFVNIIHSCPLTFSHIILVLHHQLGEFSRLSSRISSCILDFVFLFFLFLILWGPKWITIVYMELGFNESVSFTIASLFSHSISYSYQNSFDNMIDLEGYLSTPNQYDTEYLSFATIYQSTHVV